MKASTKKTILITLASVAGVLLLAALGLFLYFQGQFSQYNDWKLKFSISYPKTWKVIKQSQPTIPVMFMSPKETKLDTFQENVSIAVQDVPSHLASLKTFSNTIVGQMKAVFKKDITISEDLPVTFGGRAGHRMVFDMANPVNIRMVIVWTIKSDKAYIYTFTSPTKSYDQFKILVDQMIRSFQLK